MTRFTVKDLAKNKPDKINEILFSGINFTLNNGDILAIKGPSGAGKTTFVKCLAELIPFESGTLILDDKTPEQMGIPSWRSRVMYVPQRPAILPGTPRQFFTKVHGFASNKDKHAEDPVEIGKEWAVNVDLWDKEWSTLSGGESQRISMAIALSCKPKVLLLDEPTSALDPKTVRLVEKTILTRNYFDAAVWITHDPEQCDRVATKVLTLSGLPNQYELIDVITGENSSLDLSQGPDEIIIQS